MGKKLFLEIVLLIIVNGCVQTILKCMHNKFCTMCCKK